MFYNCLAARPSEWKQHLVYHLTVLSTISFISRGNVKAPSTTMQCSEGPNLRHCHGGFHKCLVTLLWCPALASKPCAARLDNPIQKLTARQLNNEIMFFACNASQKIMLILLLADLCKTVQICRKLSTPLCSRPISGAELIFVPTHNKMHMYTYLKEIRSRQIGRTHAVAA